MINEQEGAVEKGTIWFREDGPWLWAGEGWVRLEHSAAKAALLGPEDKDAIGVAIFFLAAGLMMGVFLGLAIAAV